MDILFQCKRLEDVAASSKSWAHICQLHIDANWPCWDSHEETLYSGWEHNALAQGTCGRNALESQPRLNAVRMERVLAGQGCHTRPFTIHFQAHTALHVGGILHSQLSFFRPARHYEPVQDFPETEVGLAKLQLTTFLCFYKSLMVSSEHNL